MDGQTNVRSASTSNCGQSLTGCVPIEGPNSRRACLPDLSVSPSRFPRLRAHPPSTRGLWRHVEALADLRWRDEPEHSLCARAASRQAGRPVPRPGRPDSAVGSPDVRTGIGAGPPGRRARLPSFVRPGLGVARRSRAHRAAHHRRGARAPAAISRSRSEACTRSSPMRLSRSSWLIVRVPGESLGSKLRWQVAAPSSEV